MRITLKTTMHGAQRYVSNELTHFTGQGLLDIEQQYAPLAKILNTGILKSRSPISSDHVGGVFMTIDPNEPLSEMYSQTVICFCDIPPDDLRIHMGKYSRFGVAFLKAFLIEKGACPVFYIPQNAKYNDWPHQTTLGEYFESIVKRFHRLTLPCSTAQDDASDDFREFCEEFRPIGQFLRAHVFSFLKLFDASLAEDHPDNYYMEREWRVRGSFQFKMDDVRRILLPESFSKRFRSDFPHYLGQLTFTD